MDLLPDMSMSAPPMQMQMPTQPMITPQQMEQINGQLNPMDSSQIEMMSGTPIDNILNINPTPVNNPDTQPMDAFAKSVELGTQSISNKNDVIDNDVGLSELSDSEEEPDNDKTNVKYEKYIMEIFIILGLYIVISQQAVKKIIVETLLFSKTEPYPNVNIVIYGLLISVIFIAIKHFSKLN